MLETALVLGLLFQGGPPLQTDDPGTPGPGKVELNVAFLAELAKDHSAYEAPLLDFNLGVGERLQLKVEVPWLIIDEEARSAVSGLGNTRLGIKYRFLDEERDGVAVSTYPQWEFNSLSSSADRGIAERGSELLFPFQVQRSLGFVSANAEIGYAYRPEGPDRWQYGLALGRDLSERFELVAELHGSTESHWDHDQLDLGVGWRWALDDRLRILFAAGRTVAGPPEDELEFFSYVGLQVLF